MGFDVPQPTLFRNLLDLAFPELTRAFEEPVFSLCLHGVRLIGALKHAIDLLTRHFCCARSAPCGLSASAGRCVWKRLLQ
jgi:hypothetical protein